MEKDEERLRDYARDRFNNNLGFGVFSGDGEFEIPHIRPEKWKGIPFIPFTEANQCKDRMNTGIHFFMDDYRFDRVWHFLKRYVEMFGQFGAVMTPDWSLYADWPLAVQVWNHYRKHYVGAVLQDASVTVYPTIAWSDERSYDWCFDGEPVGGTVAVSSVGTQKSPDAKLLFLSGYEEMIRRLKPETVIFYGDVPPECDGAGVVKLEQFQKRFDKRRGKK